MTWYAHVNQCETFLNFISVVDLRFVCIVRAALVEKSQRMVTTKLQIQDDVSASLPLFLSCRDERSSNADSDLSSHAGLYTQGCEYLAS